MKNTPQINKNIYKILFIIVSIICFLILILSLILLLLYINKKEDPNKKSNPEEQLEKQDDILNKAFYNKNFSPSSYGLKVLSGITRNATEFDIEQAKNSMDFLNQIKSSLLEYKGDNKTLKYKRDYDMKKCYIGNNIIINIEIKYNNIIINTEKIKCNNVKAAFEGDKLVYFCMDMCFTKTNKNSFIEYLFDKDDDIIKILVIDKEQERNYFYMIQNTKEEPKIVETKVGSDSHRILF